jgi:hypothetical protein
MRGLVRTATAPGRLASVGGIGEGAARLRELHAADWAALRAWWPEQSRVIQATDRRERVRESGRGQRRRIMEGISERQQTWAERAIADGSRRPVSESARVRQRRVASIRPRLIEAQTRHDERLAVEDVKVANAEQTLAEATRALVTQIPWAAQVTGLTRHELARLGRRRPRSSAVPSREPGGIEMAP